MSAPSALLRSGSGLSELSPNAAGLTRIRRRRRPPSSCQSRFRKRSLLRKSQSASHPLDALRPIASRPGFEPRLFACPRPCTGGAFVAHPAHFRVSHLGRSDHSAPQRADRANFSEGAAGEMPATPERNLGGRDFSEPTARALRHARLAGYRGGARQMARIHRRLISLREKRSRKIEIRTRMLFSFSFRPRPSRPS